MKELTFLKIMRFKMNKNIIYNTIIHIQHLK